MKLTGCCTCCNKEVYEIRQKYASDHVYAGQPMKVGKPFDARQYEMLLSDGSTMTVTYCSDCKPDLARDWHTILEAWGRELNDEHRSHLGLPPASQEAKNWFYAMTDEFPLAILGSKYAH